MGRTLQDIDKDIEILEKELKPIRDKAKAISSKISALKYEKEQYRLKNGLFEPMSNLLNHIGKRIISIELVERLGNGTLKVKEIYGDDIFEIDKNGHLDYSSYFGGVMDFEIETGKYVEYRHYHRIEYDFVGYLSLTLENEEQYEI